jgi:hypothetical protein
MAKDVIFEKPKTKLKPLNGPLSCCSYPYGGRHPLDRIGDIVWAWDERIGNWARMYVVSAANYNGRWNYRVRPQDEPRCVPFWTDSIMG